MKLVAVGILLFSAMSMAAYEGSIDLSSCGKDRVADPQTYRARFEIETKVDAVAIPTAVRKIEYECESDVCSGRDAYTYFRCESELKFHAIPITFSAYLGNEMIGRASNQGAYSARKSVAPNRDGSCPATLDFSGATFFNVEGRPQLDLGRGRRRHLSINMHMFAEGTLRRIEGGAGAYAVRDLTFTRKAFQWQHGQEPYNVNHYCSGTSESREVR